MNTKLILCLFSFILLLSSCKDEHAYLKVTNKVHNVRLENISFGEIPLGSYILPGESTSEYILSDNDDRVSFPMSKQISFYMVKGDNRVYLKTKEYYRVDKNQNLIIEISDETEVVNPMNE